MSNFIAYNVALELVRALRPIMEQLKSHSRDLSDQIERPVRASCSTSVRVIGAPGKTGGDSS
jgi:hypothetical protein